uniref:Death-associated protein kinase 1-like n=1 Tax=Saccoglossus kowalevskii TaxID=10224 RepID=A0ABM0M5K3_SACKO
YNKTPLHYAVEKGDHESVDALVSEGANVNVVDKYNKTPLHYAVEKGDHESVQILISAGANVDVVDEEFDTPLHKATLYGFTPIVELLIKYSANMNAVNKDKDTSLHLAAFNGRTPIVEKLLHKGANVNAVNKGGDTPLMDACCMNKLDIATLLLSKSADVNHYNMKHKNALFKMIDEASWCVKTSQDKANALNIMKILLEKNIDMMSPNKDETAIEYVRSKIGTGSDLQNKFYEEAEILLTKVKKERDYKILQKEQGIPIETTKLLFCGDGGSGKTTLKKSLLKTSKSKAGPAPGKDNYVLTPGIDISKEKVPGVGKMVMLDMAGQESYFSSHAMFLYAGLATIIVMYQVCDFINGKIIRPLDIMEREKTRITKWFQMLKVRNPGVKLTVILVGSRADWAKKFNYYSEAFKMAKTLKEGLEKIFSQYIHILDELLILNVHDYASSGMKTLRRILKTRREYVIQISEPMPAICAKILRRKKKWIKKRKFFPVMYWNDYVTNVRLDIDSSVEEVFLSKASEYLYDNGDILYIRMSDMEAVIILVPQWFCDRIIGPLMATDLFVQYAKILKKQTIYTFEDIQEVLVKEADMGLLIPLLTHFDIIVPLSANDYGGGHQGKYIIPNLLSTDMPKDKWKAEPQMRLYFGKEFLCKAEADMFSPNFFPRLQARLHDLYTKLQRPPSGIWKNGIKLCEDVEALVFLSEDKRDVGVAVRCEGRNQFEECHSLKQKVAVVMRQVLHETSPGADVEFHVTSRFSLRNHHDLNEVRSYPIEQILQAEKMKVTVYDEVIGIAEEVTDLLVPGFDLTVLKENGIKSDVKWMEHKTRQEVAILLEKERDDTKDHRLLSRYMGISRAEHEAIAARASNAGLYVTDLLLDKWSENWVTTVRRDGASAKSTDGKVYHESSIENLLEINKLYLENYFVTRAIEDMLKYPDGKPQQAKVEDEEEDE